MNDDPGWSPLSRTVGWFVEGVMHGGGGGIGYGGHCSSPWYSSCGGEGVMCGEGGGIGYGGHCSSPWYSSCGGEGALSWCCSTPLPHAAQMGDILIAVQQHSHYCTTTKLCIRMAACHSVKLSIIIILFIQVTMILYYNSIMNIVDRIVNKKT